VFRHNHCKGWIMGRFGFRMIIRRMIWAAVLLLCPAAAPGYASDYLLFSKAEAAAIKEGIKNHSPALQAPAAKLRDEAEKCMKRGPWSVTFHRPKGVPAGPNDFFSEGPYWWPDPANPNAPFIRRDGEVNPDRFVDNDRDMREMSEAVLVLGAAAWIFDEPRFADRASRIISVWFIDEATRMNSNLEFGQAIRNINTGRGTGIIDSIPLIYAVQGMYFLDETGRWSPRDRAAVMQWFGDYVEWLVRSPKGIEERKSGNNHSTWYAAQVAAYALFSIDEESEYMVWDLFQEFLVPGQIRPDGSCPKEESRTKSLSYSAMNLNGFSLLCRLAERQSVMLWKFRPAGGSGVEKSFEYLAPYIADPQKWTRQQIARFDGGNAYFLALAGLGLHRQDFVDIYRKVAKINDPWMIMVDLLVQSRE
jgi:hypothetical protein